MNVLTLNIGDWTRGGHGEVVKYNIISNLSVNDVQEAYFNTCKVLQLQLHDGDGLVIDVEAPSWRFLCTDYEDNIIDDRVIEILNINGCDVDLDSSLDDVDFFNLFMWFVKKSNPEFEYEMLKTDNINGYWQKELNSFIGYGVLGY